MQRRERYVLTIFFVTTTFVWTTEAGPDQSQNYDDQPTELPPRPRRRKHKEDLPPIPSEVGGTDEPALNFETGLWTDNSDGDWEPELEPKSKALEKCEKRGEIYFPATELRVPLFRPAATKLGYVMCRYSKAAIKFMTLQGLKGQDLLYWQYVNYFSTQAGNKYLEKRGLSIRVELPDEKSKDLSKRTAGRTGTFKRDTWEPRKSSGSELSYGETEPDTSFVPDLRRKCESYGDLDFNGVRVHLKRPTHEYTWDGRKRIVCRWSPAFLKAMDVLKVNITRFKKIYSKSPLLARVYLWWMHKTRIKRPRRADGSDTGYFSDSSSISRIASRITPKTISRLLSSSSSRSSSSGSSGRYSRAVSRTG